MLKVGYLGPKGTFSQEAVQKYIQNKPYESCAYNTIPEILHAVQNGEIHEAVVPIENSLEGAVNETLDMMATDSELKIKSELVIAVKQNLLVRKGIQEQDIKYIFSHPQPVGQCRQFLNSRFPHSEIRLVYSTALAAQEVARGSGDLAAIGSIAAAEAYDLVVLAGGIQDRENNFTRFVVIAKEDGKRTGSDKTSIVFSTADKPGSLFRILDIFNLWDINMTRIESRPAKNELGKYIFFVDVKGHRQDDDIRDALTMVERKSSFYKFLGSYPEWNVIS